MSDSNNEGLKCNLSIDPEKEISRRDFLSLSALWACIAAWTMTTIGLLRFPKPALLPDVSKIFKIGRVSDFPIGTVKVLQERKVVIIRDGKGIYAVSLICTHLGCIVSKEDKGGYSCPCHGSKFNDKGEVMAGPAPTALNWLDVSLHSSGKLVVNAGKRVPVGKRFVV